MPGVLLVLVIVAGVWPVWWCNRDILRDLYDYSTLIGAAGKIEAGLKPYVDVRSPMQTSVYYFNWLTECAFGRTYLALSWGGLVQALVGGGLMLGLLWRRIGPVGAAVMVKQFTDATLSEEGERDGAEFSLYPSSLEWRASRSSASDRRRSRSSSKRCANRCGPREGDSGGRREVTRMGGS